MLWSPCGGLSKCASLMPVRKPRVMMFSAASMSTTLSGRCALLFLAHIQHWGTPLRADLCRHKAMFLDSAKLCNALDLLRERPFMLLQLCLAASTCRVMIMAMASPVSLASY